MEPKSAGSKKRIVLASVLKPIDDTRMYEKLGKSLSDTELYDVFIIGFPAKKEPSGTGNIHLIETHNFKRLSITRFLAPFNVLKITIKVKPEILIVNTHELLIVAILNRILFGSKIMYDIQENYWRNILYTNAFPMAIRLPLAIWVRCKEIVTSPLFHWNLLAEKGYQKELSFFGVKATVIENKVRLPRGFSRLPEIRQFNLLFSGTLAESTGVFECIELAKKLHTHEPAIQLLLIGFCAKEDTLKKIENEIKGFDFIQLRGGHVLVPHAEILEAIAKSSFGLIYYPTSPHIENSMPTKLYEYLGCQLPILLQDVKPWTELTAPFQASINIDFTQPNAEAILKQMRSTSFYLTTPQNVMWENEEPKFLAIVEKLLAR